MLGEPEAYPYDWPEDIDMEVLPVEAARPGYRQLAADLRQQILGGTLAPGEPLPANSALAAQYGVSMSLANAAVAQLEREGLVLVGHGRPTTVRPRRRYRAEVTGARWTGGDVISGEAFTAVADALAAAEEADPALADADLTAAGASLALSVMVTAADEGHAALRASRLVRHVTGDGWDLDGASVEARPE